MFVFSSIRGAAQTLSAIAVVLSGLTGCSSAEGGTATVRVTEAVLLETPPRLGVNLGATTYYNDQQYVANPFAHGGFRQGRQVLLIQAAAGATGSRVKDAYFDPSDPDRSYTESFAGGSYCIATGPRAGEEGAVVGHELRTGVFELGTDGTALEEGEVLWLFGPWADRARPESQDPGIEKTAGIGDFRAHLDTGVSLGYAAEAGGRRDQVLQVTFPAGGQRLYGGVKHYIQASPSTTYRVHVRARSEIAGATIGVSMRNYGIDGGQPGHEVAFFATGGNALSPEWKTFAFEGSTYANPEIREGFSEIAVAAVAEAVGGGAVMLDDLALEIDGDDAAGGFREDVVAALEEARCGTLRFYGTADLGSLVEGITADNATQSPWTFLSLASFFRFSTTSSVVDQWLTLSKAVDADPWITVGSANTPGEWWNLVSYLAAPADYDAFSRRRETNGRQQPWTESFSRIYLEIGNEWWNPIFRPFYIWPPEKYGALCNLIIERIRSHPHFNPEKIKLVVGGWAINAHHWNGIVDATVEGHDYLSIAPYLLHELDQFSTPEDKYGTLFAGVDAYTAFDGKSTLDDLAKNESSARLAVYELNTHLTGGNAPASVASEIAPSAAAGIAVLDQAMSLMADMKATPVNYFTLLQRAFGQGEQRRNGLWGVMLRTDDGDLRPRPVWQGLRLANRYLIAGDMVAVEVEGATTWRQPQNAEVPEMRAVPALHAYAFLDAGNDGKRRCNVLLINRDLKSPLSVSLSLPFAPAPEVKQVLLGCVTPADNNEEQLQVKLDETTLASYQPEQPITVPPVAALALQFSEK